MYRMVVEEAELDGESYKQSSKKEHSDLRFFLSNVSFSLARLGKNPRLAVVLKSFLFEQ